MGSYLVITSYCTLSLLPNLSTSGARLKSKTCRTPWATVLHTCALFVAAASRKKSFLGAHCNNNVHNNVTTVSWQHTSSREPQAAMRPDFSAACPHEVAYWCAPARCCIFGPSPGSSYRPAHSRSRHSPRPQCEAEPDPAGSLPWP